jgi:hypothetical protein
VEGPQRVVVPGRDLSHLHRGVVAPEDGPNGERSGEGVGPGTGSLRVTTHLTSIDGVPRRLQGRIPLLVRLTPSALAAPDGAVEEDP